MFRSLFLVPALLTAVLAVAEPASAGPGAADLSGTYACSGINPDGSGYESVVEIARLNGAYQLRWVVDSEVIAVGMGIRYRRCVCRRLSLRFAWRRGLSN